MQEVKSVRLEVSQVVMIEVIVLQETAVVSVVVLT